MKNILLVGNPNVGKTAILNKLSGSTYNIGNWAGVTVARQEGILNTDKETLHLLDLPGIYSLIPCSEDEYISIQEIFTGNYDLIINVIDLNELHQNLMLTAELLELGVPMIGILNFYDEFEKNYELDMVTLQDLLKIPIIPTSAHTSQGLEELKHMLSLTDNYSSWISPLRITKNKEYQDLVHLFPTAEIRYPLAGISPLIDPALIYNYLSIKHPLFINRFHLDPKELTNSLEQNQDHLPNYLDDIIQKKEFIITQAPVSIKEGCKDKHNFIKYVDHFLLHPIFGYLFFAIIMGGLFTMVFNIANPFIDFIDWLIGEKITLYANMLLQGTRPELHSFIVEGLIGGVGGVITFVPLIFILYIFLAFLEESGYLARIAILLEHPFSKIGLSGKAFFPMLLGFGCTVPAIYGSRVLETPALRQLTAIISSLISCGARLPVYVLFISAFFPNNSGLILLSLYLLGIFLAIILAFIISRFPDFSSKNSCFVLVLPNYRFPNLSIVSRKALVHASGYLKKAGGIILGMLMLMWVFSYFPSNGDVANSYMATVGKKIQPIFKPLGFGDRWEPVVSIIPSLVAKESVVGFFGQVLLENNFEESENPNYPELTISEEVQEIGLVFLDTVKSSIFGLISWNFFNIKQFDLEENRRIDEESGLVYRLSQLWTDEHRSKKAYSFMIFILLTLPCVVATGALKQELSNKNFIFTVLLYLVLPFLCSLIYYQTAILF
ncbi:MAG: ferrous iron transport protein B [Brevinema sp.]